MGLGWFGMGLGLGPRMGMGPRLVGSGLGLGMGLGSVLVLASLCIQPFVVRQLRRSRRIHLSKQLNVFTDFQIRPHFWQAPEVGFSFQRQN
jgi:hypothetical protein